VGAARLGAGEIVSFPDAEPVTTMDMIGQAAEALSQVGLLTGAHVLATERMAQGKASTVCKVVLSTGRTVMFKSAKARVVEMEALWLRGWGEIGVDTPEVYGTGVLADGTPYLLMQHLNGPNVEADVGAGRLPFEGTMRTIGRMLATMHTIRGTGFGSSHWEHLDSSGNGRFATLSEHLFSENLARGLAFANDIGAISEQDCEAVDRAVDLLSAHAAETGPRRTHGDFRAGNMIHNGDRLVVIDPTPALTHPYLCLAYSLLEPPLFADVSMADFLAGYQEVAPVDLRVLDAALLVRAGIMFDSFGRRRHTEHGLRIPALFARQRERFMGGG
jgi:aminoglycoside phosphotransferase (APT) family kinase protein